MMVFLLCVCGDVVLSLPSHLLGGQVSLVPCCILPFQSGNPLAVVGHSGCDLITTHLYHSGDGLGLGELSFYAMPLLSVLFAG